LLAAGIRIHARDLPEVEEEYRRPMPIRTEYRNGRAVEIDPELAPAS
jgi:hypothetical protein